MPAISEKVVLLQLKKQKYEKRNILYSISTYSNSLYKTK